MIQIYTCAIRAKKQGFFGKLLYGLNIPNERYLKFLEIMKGALKYTDNSAMVIYGNYDIHDFWG